jgi:hypothetical protein
MMIKGTSRSPEKQGTVATKTKMEWLCSHFAELEVQTLKVMLVDP